MKPQGGYHNTAVQCREGHWHRSKLESSVCAMLHLRSKARELVVEACEDYVYLSKARILYVADFRCRMLLSNQLVWFEAKGIESDRWPTIKKLWKHYGPGELQIWKGTHLRPALAETIVPKVDS